DPNIIPLLTNSDRRDVARYAALPGPKALAISADGWGVASNAPDLESAKKEALERCSTHSRSLSVCKIYAADMDVVWAQNWVPLPLPADLHSDLLDERFIADQLPFLSPSRRQYVTDGYVAAPDHKAFALRGYLGGYLQANAAEPAEAVRVALERCGYRNQVACLVVSVDGMVTLRIPKSRRVVDTFMLTTEPEISDSDKQRIGQIYQQKEWRALARGKRGTWHAVANAPSEGAAV